MTFTDTYVGSRATRHKAMALCDKVSSRALGKVCGYMVMWAGFVFFFLKDGLWIEEEQGEGFPGREGAVYKGRKAQNLTLNHQTCQLGGNIKFL